MKTILQTLALLSGMITLIVVTFFGFLVSCTYEDTKCFIVSGKDLQGKISNLHGEILHEKLPTIYDNNFNAYRVPFETYQKLELGSNYCHKTRKDSMLSTILFVFIVMGLLVLLSRKIESAI